MSVRLRTPRSVAVALACIVASPWLASPANHAFSVSAQTPIARIEGRVTGPNRRPVQNIRISLLNDGYSQLGSVYTDGSGRFQFTAPAGTYYLDVEPQGQPYDRQRQRIELNPAPVSNLGELFHVDIQLVALTRPDAATSGVPGVRFAQTVPENARAEFERAKRLVKTKPEEAQEALRRAVQAFPDYYDALDMLGGEYVKAGYFDFALPILLHSLEVNPDSVTSYYSIGVVYYRMKHYPNAQKAFRRVLKMAPDSPNASVYLGLALLRGGGDKKEAENALTRASELGAGHVAEVRLALADIFIEQKRFEEAAQQLQLLLKDNPGFKDRAKIESLIVSLREKAKNGAATVGAR